MNRKKNKKMLVKRINLKSNTYDFIIKDKCTAFRIIESTKNEKCGIKFTKPNQYNKLIFYIGIFFRENKKAIVLAVIILLLTYPIKYILDKWICP